MQLNIQNSTLLAYCVLIELIQKLPMQKSIKDVMTGLWGHLQTKWEVFVSTDRDLRFWVRTKSFLLTIDRKLLSPLHELSQT